MARILKKHKIVPSLKLHCAHYKLCLSYTFNNNTFQCTIYKNFLIGRRNENYILGTKQCSNPVHEVLESRVIPSLDYLKIDCTPNKEFIHILDTRWGDPDEIDNPYPNRHKLWNFNNRLGEVCNGKKFCSFQSIKSEVGVDSIKKDKSIQAWYQCRSDEGPWSNWSTCS